MHTVIRAACLAMLVCALSHIAAAEDLPAAIDAYLHQSVGTQLPNVAIVVGLIDDHGRSTVSYGQLDNGTPNPVTADTLFEIGSVTKTFTALLFQDAINRGEVHPDTPVATCLPPNVKLPTRNGHHITLRQLATHTSGLPDDPYYTDPQHPDNPYADYTADRMYAFLSDCRLTRDPGARPEYSNLGMGLLGHALALKANTTYESLLLDRICRPLHMTSTRITITPDLQPRFAAGHNPFGEPVPSWDLNALAAAGALRSTANDLLNYLSADLALTPSPLTPVMANEHTAALAWESTPAPDGTPILQHGGGTGGFQAFIAMDKTHRRGVVVLLSSKATLDVEDLGRFLLTTEWRPDHRPTPIALPPPPSDSYPGLYELTPTPPPRTPTWPAYAAFASCLAALILLLRWPTTRRRRIAFFACTLPAAGVVVALLSRPHPPAVPTETRIGIRRDGDRLFAQPLGPLSSPAHLLPPVTAELLPQSDTRFFERLSGTPLTFSLDPRRRATSLTTSYLGAPLTYQKMSDVPPDAPRPPRRPVAITLPPHLLDAVTGRYKFPPNAVSPTPMTLTIRRQGDHLVGRAQGQHALKGDFDIFPESESTFFIKINAAELTFLKNPAGRVTTLIHHKPGLPDFEATKLD